MDRRDFGRTLAGAAAGATLSSIAAVGSLAHEPPFKFSVMLWTVDKNLPFEQRLEKVAQAGYAAVELVDEFKGWSDADFQRANARKRQLKLTFDATAGVWKGIADPHGIDAFVADLNSFVPTAKKLECSDIIVLSGDRVEGTSREQQHHACIESLKRGGRSCGESTGCDFCSRTSIRKRILRYYLTSVAEGFEIVREVNHPRVKFLYDFYHEQISEGNLIKKLTENIKSVGLVHIADVPGRHQPGTGEIGYASIYRKLAELKYSDYVAMEFEAEGDLVDTLRKAREQAIEASNKSIF